MGGGTGTGPSQPRGDVCDDRGNPEGVKYFAGNKYKPNCAECNGLKTDSKGNVRPCYVSRREAKLGSTA